MISDLSRSRLFFLTLPIVVIAQLVENGGLCYGNVSYCAPDAGSGRTDLILHCNLTLGEESCNAFLGERPTGALCVESSPTKGDATCSAMSSSFTGFPFVSGGLGPSPSASTLLSSTFISSSVTSANSAVTRITTETAERSATVTTTTSETGCPGPIEGGVRKRANSTCDDGGSSNSGTSRSTRPIFLLWQTVMLVFVAFPVG